MIWANRNAFYYVLDRATGEFILGKPFAKQTWAEGLDENGRPILRPNVYPSREGTLISPMAGGAYGRPWTRDASYNTYFAVGLLCYWRVSPWHPRLLFETS